MVNIMINDGEGMIRIDGDTPTVLAEMVLLVGEMYDKCGDLKPHIMGKDFQEIFAETISDERFLNGDDEGRFKVAHEVLDKRIKAIKGGKKPDITDVIMELARLQEDADE